MASKKLTDTNPLAFDKAKADRLYKEFLVTCKVEGANYADALTAASLFIAAIMYNVRNQDPQHYDLFSEYARACIESNLKVLDR